MANKIYRPDSRLLRERRDKISAALSKLKSMEKETEKLEDKIREAVSAVTEVQVKALLSAMDVEELNRGKKGIRVAALRAAGINDLGQLYGLSRGKLESIEGIGEMGAQTIYSTVRSIAELTRSNIRIKLSVEDKSREFAAMLPPVYQYMLTDGARKRGRELSKRYGSQAESAVRESKKAQNTIGWAFASKETKQAAARASAQLDHIVFAGFAEDAEKNYKEYMAVSAPDEKRAREAFERNSAGFAVVLDELGINTAGESGWSAIPAELAEKVNALPLDLRYLKATLRPYQVFGTKYILTQKRTLLGDEMGLGKTMQAIAAMAALKAEGGEKFLVVCPASVLVNWCREIEQHSELEVTEIHGNDKGDELRRWISKGTVAVTTYETARSLTLPEEFKLSMLVADEAHYVKNPYALRTRALMNLADRSEHVLYMTGTPIENNVDEMCFLMSTLQPETAKTVEELKLISSAPQFREGIAPVYLRRTRDDVLTELPEKIEQEQWCRPTDEDKKHYMGSVLAKNFMAMRRIAWDHSDLDKSSKAQRLMEILEMAKEEGRKVIVFSYFLDTAEKVCHLVGDGVYGPINGSVTAAKRQQIVDEFTAAPDGAVLVSQVTAGGTGLNIQAASVVIFCEPQIKPSMETQAISRAYRMGQARSVLVYRLLCTGTVDEDIYTMLQTKQEIFDTFAEDSVAGSESLRTVSMQKWIDNVIAEQTEKLTQQSQE